MIYEFGEFQLDTARFELRRGGELLSVQRTVLATLMYLIEHRDRVATKDELIAGPWQGVSVSDASISQAVMLARKALVDSGIHQRFIKTVRGYGYRFVGSVRTHHEQASPAPPPAASASSEGRGVVPALFGRELEMAQAVAALDAAVSGQGSLVLLAGPPGIGKTQLCDQIAKLALERSVPVVWGRSWEAGGAPAFWPWLQVFQRLLDDPELDAAAEISPREVAHLVQLFPEIEDRFPNLQRDSGGAVEPQRLQLFESTASVLRRIGKRHGALLLVLEDLHVSDVSSVALLDYVAGGLHAAHVLIAASYRDVELRSVAALHALVTGLRGVRCTLQLSGLKESDAAAMLGPRQAGHGTDWLQRIHRATAGNPLFLQEVRRLLEAEQLDASDVDSVRFRIPGRIAEAIRHHLRKLPAPTGRLIELAAVIGPDFDLPLLQAVVQGPAAELLDTLAPAIAAGLLQESYEALARYRFSHELIRNTVYGDIAAAGRIALHRQVGEAIESMHNAWDAPFSRLAHHFLAAAVGGGADKAATYAIKAGDRALGSTAYVEAIEHYQLGLQAFELRPDAVSERGDLMLKLGQAQRLAGRSGEAMQTFARAVSLARNARLPTLFAKAALGHGFTWRAWASDETLIALLKESLALLDDRDSRLRAVVMARLAASLWFSGPELRALRARLSADAIAMARRLGNPMTLSVALVCSHTANWGVMGLEAQLELANEIVAVAESAALPGLRDFVQEGHLWRIADLFELGRLAEAKREIARYAKEAEHGKHPLELSWVARWRSVLSAMAGNLIDARALAAQARELGEQAGDKNAAPFYWEQRLLLDRADGSEEDAVPRLERMLDHNPDLVLAQLRLARAYASSGAEARALHILEPLAADGFSRMPDNHTRFSALVSGALACARLKAADAAQQLYARLLPDAERILTFGTAAVCYGPAQYFLGLLAHAAGRFEPATHHFQLAAERAAQLDAPLWVIDAQLCEAGTRLEHEGRSHTVDALLQQARLASERLGLRGFEARARERYPRSS